MKTTTLTILGAILLWTSICPAGNEGGHGGHTVVCRDAGGKVTPILLLDFYEAEQLWDIHHDLGPAGDYQSKVQLALERLKRLDPVRSAQYSKWADSFSSEAKWIKGATLVDIPDSKHLFFAKGCKVEQTINQSEPRFAEDHRYLIDAELWDLLDEDGKAGLILHEVIYREGIASGQTDSRGARYLNVQITSSEFESFTQKEYLDRLKRVGYSDYATHGISIQVNDPGLSFYDSGEILSAMPSQELSPVTIGTNRGNALKRRMSFFKSGAIRSAAMEEDFSYVVGAKTVQIDSHVWDGEGAYSAVEFYEDGHVHYIPRVYAVNEAKYDGLVTVQGKHPHPSPWSEKSVRLEFYPSGALRSIFPKEDIELITNEGKKLFAGGHYYLEFDESGMVTKWTNVTFIEKDSPSSFVSRFGKKQNGLAYFDTAMVTYYDPEKLNVKQIEVDTKGKSFILPTVQGNYDFKGKYLLEFDRHQERVTYWKNLSSKDGKH